MLNELADGMLLRRYVYLNKLEKGCKTLKGYYRDAYVSRVGEADAMELLGDGCHGVMNYRERTGLDMEAVREALGDEWIAEHTVVTAQYYEMRVDFD